jgi:hypothetical protein
VRQPARTASAQHQADPGTPVWNGRPGLKVGRRKQKSADAQAEKQNPDFHRFTGRMAGSLFHGCPL